MFMGQNLMKLLAKFPPREHSKPMLSGLKMGPRLLKMAELGLKTFTEQEIKNDQVRRNGIGVLNRAAEIAGLEVEILGAEEISNDRMGRRTVEPLASYLTYFPTPKLDAPMFEGQNHFHAPKSYPSSIIHRRRKR